MIVPKFGDYQTGKKGRGGKREGAGNPNFAPVDYLLTVTSAIIIVGGEDTDKKPEILGYLARVLEAWNNPEAVRLRAAQMGIVLSNVTLSGSKRPMLEDSRGKLEALKEKKERASAHTDLVLHQFILECLKITGERRHFVDSDDAYRVYCGYASDPLPKEKFLINVCYANTAICLSKGMSRLTHCLFSRPIEELL